MKGYKTNKQAKTPKQQTEVQEKDSEVSWHDHDQPHCLIGMQLLKRILRKDKAD